MSKFYTVSQKQQAEKQFGERQSTVVAKRAAAAARRQLQSLPLQSHHAFAHIREHFRDDASKPSHGVFLPEYQQPTELTKLLLRAIDAPGTEPMLSKSDDGDWAVVIQTWFGAGHPIGYSPAGQGRQELAFLCFIVDLNGDLITAYPVAGYRMPGSRV
ncbi:MAG TPA: hypothetical protein PLN21_14865 [Gemmatales bacterium]|nr:hypothetical protein [Gemmatales bacterium]